MLIILCKWAEMLYQFSALVYLVYAIIALIFRPEASKKPLIEYNSAPFLTFLYGVSLYNNNLFSNLRYSIKTPFLFKLCFQWPEAACAPCRKQNWVVCREALSFQLFVKWAVLIFLALGLFFIDKIAMEEVEAHDAEGHHYTELQIASLIIALQMPAFMLFRLIVFPVWTLLTCWCELGEPFDAADTFEWSKISYKYTQYQDSYQRRQDRVG